MPPLQKRALYSLIAAIVVPAAVVGIILLVKPTPDVLLLFAIATIALVYFVPRYLTRPRPDRPVIADERDKAILSSVPRYQYVGVLLAIGAWIIILYALYHDKGQIPIRFLSWMLLSVFAANTLFATAGVMIGYWRAKPPSQQDANPDLLLGAAITGKWRIAGVIVLILVYAITSMVHQESTAPTCQIEPRFTSTYTETNVGFPVRFIDTSVGDATWWEWDFGDNTVSEEQNPVHAYTNPGQYTVELWIGCRGGNSVHVKKDGYILVLPSGAP